MEFNPSPEGTTTLEGVGPGRDERSRWAQTLRRLQLNGLVGWFLDAGGPFTLLSAQLMYLASPLLGRGAERIGHLLESDEELQAFSRLLGMQKGFEDGPEGREAG